MRPELVVSKNSQPPQAFLLIKPKTESSFIRNFENDLNVDLTSLQGSYNIHKDRIGLTLLFRKEFYHLCRQQRQSSEYSCYNSLQC